jgi:hypothetical protein
VDTIESLNQLSVAVVYVDEHLIQLEARVDAGNWRGRAQAYTVPEEVATFAKALQEFAEAAVVSAEFSAGDDNGIGLIGMRFYRIDRSGHVALYIRLATGHMPPRPEQVSRLWMEVRAETWGVSQFAKQLAELARAQSGRASLVIEPEA